MLRLTRTEQELAGCGPCLDEGGGSGGIVGDWTGAFAALVTSDVSYGYCSATGEGGGSGAIVGEWTGAFAALETLDVSYRYCRVKGI